MGHTHFHTHFTAITHCPGALPGSWGERTFYPHLPTKGFSVRRAVILSLAAIAGDAPALCGQGPITPSDAAGRWAVESMVGPRDSVVARHLFTITRDGKGSTMKFPGHEPIPVRVVASGGDSVVIEAGPYPSVVRPGQTVTLLRTIWHYKGDAMTGTFEVHYGSGTVLQGKTRGTRHKYGARTIVPAAQA